MLLSLPVSAAPADKRAKVVTSLFVKVSHHSHHSVHPLAGSFDKEPKEEVEKEAQETAVSSGD